MTLEEDEDIDLRHNSKRWFWLFPMGIMTITLITKQIMIVQNFLIKHIH